MVFGSGFETAVQNDELFKSKKTKKYKPPTPSNLWRNQIPML